jgi:hypothetical protein
MSSDQEALFCSKPFTWLEVSRGTLAGEGDAFLCCPAWLSTPVGNAQTQTIEEIWNGERAQAIRASIHDGSFRFCDRTRCPFLQSPGGDGPVQRRADVSEPLLRDAIDRRLTVLPHGPLDINCSYDRSCNLSCPSCRTKVIVESREKDRVLRIQRRLTEEALPGARMLYITGSGDPFGSPFFRRWLQTMDRANMPNVRTIHLHTNALLFTPRMWETIPADVRALVKDVDISIDAARAETYAVNRRGGDFDTLLRNLEFIVTLRADGPLRWLGINMVVQANNFREMPEFVALGKRFRVDTVYFQQLVNWGTFTDAEFAERAVHLPGHPLHDELRAVLHAPALDDPCVMLGNLLDTKRELDHDAPRVPRLRRALRSIVGSVSRYISAD